MISAALACPDVAPQTVNLTFNAKTNAYDASPFVDVSTDLLLNQSGTDFTVCYSFLGAQLMGQFAAGCFAVATTSGTTNSEKSANCINTSIDAIQDAIALYSQQAAKKGAKLAVEPDPPTTDLFQGGSCPAPIDPYKEETKQARIAMDTAKCVSLDVKGKGSNFEQVVTNIGTGGMDGTTGYLLRRTGTDAYEAELNLDFDLPKKRGREYDKELLNNDWRNVVQTCLDKFVNGNLSGPPKDKKKLKIVLGDKSSKAPKRTILAADEELGRDNSGAWSPIKGCTNSLLERDRDAYDACMKKQSNFTDRCPLIAHELSHLLGLVDEYEEKGKGHIVTANGTRIEEKKLTTDQADSPPKNFVPLYDCRVLGPNDSLMWDHSLAFKALKGYKLIKVCSCPAADDWAVSRDSKDKDECMTKIAKAKISSPKTCSPVGNYWEDSITPDSPNYDYSSGDVHKRDKFVSVSKAVKKRASLLYPAQFRAIVYPGCAAKGKSDGEGDNRTYMTCASEAYKTSPKAFGKARCDDSLPKECSTDKPGAGWLK